MIRNLFGAQNQSGKSSEGRKKIRLGVEWLEARDCPAGSIMALGDTYNLIHDHSLATGLASPVPLGVLANDYNPTGSPLSVVGNTSPSHGSLTMQANGTFNYSPFTSFVGQDSFNYTISNGFQTSTATVILNVNNNAPVANQDQFSNLSNGVIQGQGNGVLGNDTDLDGDSLIAFVVQSPTHGSLQMQSNGSFTYTPVSWFAGTDSFSYRAFDGASYSNITQAILNVPMALSPGLMGGSIGEGQMFMGTLATLAVDNPMNPASNYSVSLDWGDGTIAQGTLSPMVAGMFQINGSHVFADNGTYTVKISVTDINGLTVSTQIPISVLNAAPQIDMMSVPASVSEGSPVSLSASYQDMGSLDTHTYSWHVTSNNGQVITDGNGLSFTFTPADNGVYGVTFTVMDDDGGMASVTKTINVYNMAPLLTLSGNTSGNEGTDYYLGLQASDPGLDTIQQWTVSWGDGTTPKTYTGDPSSVSHAYTTPGTYTISASATDEDGTYQAPMTKLVTVMNVAPVINLSVSYGSERWVTLSGQVFDAYSVSNLVVVFGGKVSGTAMTDAQGHFSYTVQADNLGEVTARVTDAFGMMSGYADVTLVSKAPTITSFEAVHESDTLWTFRGRITDESCEGLSVALGGLSSLQQQTAVVQSDGTFAVTIRLQQGEEGLATALATDWWGLQSNLGEILV